MTWIAGWVFLCIMNITQSGIRINEMYVDQFMVLRQYLQVCFAHSFFAVDIVWRIIKTSILTLALPYPSL